MGRVDLNHSKVLFKLEISLRHHPTGSDDGKSQEHGPVYESQKRKEHDHMNLGLFCVE